MKNTINLLGKISILFWIFILIYSWYVPYAHENDKIEHLANGNWLVCPSEQNKEFGYIFIKPVAKNSTWTESDEYDKRHNKKFKYKDCFGVSAGTPMIDALYRVKSFNEQNYISTKPYKFLYIPLWEK